MPSNGKVTLGDALSPEMRAQMGRLRESLLKRAQETIKAQLGQPKATWQAKSVVPREIAGSRSKQASAKPSSPDAGRIESLPWPLFGERQARVNNSRPKATRSRTEPKEEPFSYWDLPQEAAVREPVPTTVTAENRNSFEHLLLAGMPPASSKAGEDIFATIGLDFGTSTTKIMVRFPYEPGTPTIAIPAPPHCRSMGHPYLWQTVLWVSESGEFSAWPSRGASLLHALKQGIMGRNADAVMMSSPKSRMSVTRVDAATAYLAFVVRYTRGWLLKNRPQVFRNRRPVWFLNVGMPVANFDDARLVCRYRQIAAAAVLIGNLEGAITAETTSVFLKDPHVLSAARSADEAEKFGVAALPETAAEAAGFAKSANRAPGLNLMVDVGAMTLDVCAFRLGQSDAATDLYGLLAAQVRPLGVEAYHWFLGEGKREPEFAVQCDHCLHEVIWRTRTKRDPLAECWQAGNDLPIFLAGGGAQNSLHRRIVEALDPWLRQHSQNEGVRLLELPMPANIDLPIGVSDFSRLAVAWGLSYPPSEIGEIVPPSAVEDKIPPPVMDWTMLFTGKEVV
jgi:hypothetical protein